MKPLQLTEEQRDKLIEMANKLFPEYISKRHQSWRFSDDELIYVKDDDIIGIHWYEFVMNWLVDAIYYPRPERRGNRNTADLIQKFHFHVFCTIVGGTNYDPIHPVDYLYTKFKEL